MRHPLLLLLLTITIGCQTAPHSTNSKQDDTVSGLTSMTSGLTNRSVTEADLKKIAVQVAHDPQAQSAIRSINTALSPQHTVKYCPVDGERFSGDVDTCPVHHVKLKWVE